MVSPVRLKHLSVCYVSMAPKLGKKVEDFIDTFGGSTEHTTPLFLTFVLDMCPYQIASLALQTFLDNLQFNLPVGRMAYKIGKAFENQARWDKALDTMHPSKLDLLAMDDRSKAMKLKQFYDYEEERFTLWDSKCKAGSRCLVVRRNKNRDWLVGRGLCYRQTEGTQSRAYCPCD